MENIEQAIKVLDQIDVGFYCTHEAPGGGTTVPLSLEEVLKYAKDPVGYLASRYGMSKSEYLAWHESEYTVHCAGKTRIGKPCKNVVEGGYGVEPQRWLELRGGYCHVHGG